MGHSLSLSMAHRTQATLGGPTWKSRAFPLSLFSLAVGYYSSCRLTSAQRRERIISTDMLAPALPTQPRVLGLPLPQGPLLAHVELGSLDLFCRALSQQFSPILGCSITFQRKRIHPLPIQSIFQCNTVSFSFSS